MTGPVHRREPDPEKLLKLPVDEIAPYFFEYLYGMGTDPFSRHNVFLNDEVAVDYPATSRASVSARLMEAWGYLERMGVIIPKPGSTEGWYTFATVAKQKGTAEALKKYIDDH